MTAYVIKRMIYLVIILSVMSVLVFSATHLLPGDAAVMILGQYSTPEALEAIRLKLGLNDPLIIQYGRWISAFVQGNMGSSLIMERPVAPMVWEALGKSMILATVSMLCVTFVGLGLGIVAAVHRGSWIDHLSSLFGYVGVSIPEFFWAIILVLLFAGVLGWLPATGFAPLSEGIWPFLSHLILPVITLTLTLIAHVSRMTRSSMIEVLHSQYVKTARAKGIPENKVIFRHALRNALLPTITVLSHDFGWLVGGIVVVEAVFGYPGIGRLLIFAMERHDLPLMQAIILILTAIFVLSNLAADLLYAYFNPRIRYGSAIE
jgi:peptide/nickel transport system permease protein